MDGSAKVVGVVKQALTEEAVAALEASTGRAPSWLTPVVVRNAAGGFDLIRTRFTGERAEWSRG